jgi:CBS domain-containing protein
MNVAFFITPKSEVVWVSSSSTLSQALERMQPNGYAAVPILDDRGAYAGTLTEGDALWYLLHASGAPSDVAAHTPLCQVARRNDYRAVHINAQMEELLGRAVDQSFVPVVDDCGSFIGIVRRKSIIQHSAGKLDRGLRIARAT